MTLRPPWRESQYRSEEPSTVPASMAAITCHKTMVPSRARTPSASIKKSPGTGIGTPLSSTARYTKAASTPCLAKNVSLASRTRSHQFMPCPCYSDRLRLLQFGVRGLNIEVSGQVQHNQNDKK